MNAGHATAPAAPLVAALALVFNALVWGLSWWPFRQLHAQGLHPLWSTAFVYLTALACLLVARPRALGGFLREPRLWLLAAASGLTNVAFNWGVTVGDVVRVVLLFYLMPAWSVLLAWAILGERPSGPALLRLVLALAGVGIVLGGEGASWPVPQGLADWLALAGGFSFALTNILLRSLRAVAAPSRAMAMFTGGMLTASGTALWGMAQGLVTPLVPLPPGAWAVAVGLALSFLAGNLALQHGAARLAAHTTALLLLSEVLFASVSAALLGAGTLTPRVLAGAALIVAAAAWSAWPVRGRRGGAGAQSAA